MKLEIIDHRNEHWIDARELHAALGVRRDFTTWFRERVEKYGFVEGQDFVCSPDLGSKDGRGGHNRTDYLMRLPMAKEVAVVENTHEGRQIRLYLIKVEEAWNRPEIVMARALLMSKEQIESMKRQLGEATALLEKAQPKIAAFDRFLDSRGECGLQEAGRALGFPPNKFIERLRADHVVFKTKRGINEPYSEHLQKKRFRLQLNEVNGITRIQTRVCSAGMAWLAERYPEHTRVP